MSQPNEQTPATEKVVEEVPEVTFATEEEALAGRAKGLAHYNKNELEHALATQVGVLKFFAAKHGENNSQMGVYYLDYGLSLLALIQGEGRSAEDAALTAVDDEDAEQCFNSLELARVAFEKAEEADDSNLFLKFQIVEVHDALAQLELEKDNSDGAVIEFDHTLLLLRDITPTPDLVKKHQQAMTSALFNSARCYMQEADFAAAAERLDECVKYITSLPAGAIEGDLLEEVKSYLADAIDNRDQKTHEKVTESIKELFPDEKQDVVASEVVTNPYLSSLPAGEERGSTNSMLLYPAAVPIPGRENSSSTSRSVFPMQGTGERSRSAFSLSNGPVNVAVARKKEKPTVVAPTEGEPATKKSRPETSS